MDTSTDKDVNDGDVPGSVAVIPDNIVYPVVDDHDVRLDPQLTEILEAATVSLGEDLADKDDTQLVVVKSPIVLGATEGVVVPLLELMCGKRLGEDLLVVMNPEFLSERTAVKDYRNPDRVVVGADDQQQAYHLETVFEPLFKRTDARSSVPARARSR